MNLNFSHNWSGTSIENSDLNTIKFTNANGEQLSIERLRYLISNITLTNADGEKTIIKERHLVNLNEEKKRASVFMDAEQVSLAIGRGGHNINLAGKLSGYEIDVYRDENSFEDDVAIDEFTDELEGWVIDALKDIGCDTAKSVLDISAEDLVSRTDLETETVEDLLNILRSEFED